MRAIMLMFDSLNREFLPNYGCDWTKMPNFERLGKQSTTFDTFYGGSMPCMPARRELHTGRYNFLHTFWTPMHPYDDSIISRMSAAKIYTHITTDHFHYWEDGGSGYLTKFDSHEMVRGQQGDPWKGQVEKPYFPETLSRRSVGENWRHDYINRGFINREEEMPQCKTFENGIDFINRSAEKDNWFLQIEAFDPHEPFYSQQCYKDLYPEDYHGKQLDWPDYGKNDYGEAATKHVRNEYAALMSMCDNYLGKLLDKMDELDMWKDTMLIVNTDHGFMLGEKEWMGKNIQPFYEEIIHSPFFIHDPRNPHANERRKALAQTIDIVPTLAEFFEIEPPQFMDGVSLTPIIKDDSTIREGALFGICGGHINITDGRYVYMHAPVKPDNSPFYEYTLMPMHMNVPYKPEELQNITLTGEFKFTKGALVMKVPNKPVFNSYWYGTHLYDLQKDPHQQTDIIDKPEQKRLIELMRELMRKNEAPKEQYERMGIPFEGVIKEEMLELYNNSGKTNITDAGALTKRALRAASIFTSCIDKEKAEQFKAALRAASQEKELHFKDVQKLIGAVAPANATPMILAYIRNFM